jgi:hypothetical protein
MIRKQGSVGSKTTVGYGDTEVVNKSLFHSKVDHNFSFSLFSFTSHLFPVSTPCIGHRTSKKYGHLPIKEAEADPWEKLCVDLIGPYTIK